MPDSAMVHEQETLILQTLEQFLERDVRPHVMELEHNDIWPEEIVHKMAELGLFGAIIDEEYGGLGLPCSTYAKICEKVAHTWMSLAGIFNSHLIMSAAVQRYGTDVQKKKWLPKFAMGELRGGIALTEPNCGTDLQAIRTRAAKNGDDFIINGTKTWISNGIHAHVMAILAKTDWEVEPRHRGISLFLVEKGEGFRASRKLEKLGYKGIDSAELVLEDCRVPADQLIGEEPGNGFKQIMGGLELGQNQCRRPWLWRRKRFARRGR